MYSLNFRKKVLEIRERDNLSMRCVAARFGVNFMSVMHWSQRLQPCLKRNKPATKIDREALKKDVGEHPDAYMGLLRAGDC